MISFVHINFLLVLLIFPFPTFYYHVLLFCVCPRLLANSFRALVSLNKVFLLYQTPFLNKLRTNLYLSLNLIYIITKWYFLYQTSYLLTDEDRQYFNMMKIILFYYVLLLFRNIQNVLLNNPLDPIIMMSSHSYFFSIFFLFLSLLFFLITGIKLWYLKRYMKFLSRVLIILWKF
jgi:hypothetical protein